MHRQQNGEKAFTLVELSIVIVIIGLIVAGITAGKSLVRTAQLRSVTTDIESYKSSINAFKLQYDALPGDFNNAYAFWGANCAASAALCNGNGNRIISPLTTEGLRAWQHLALGGILKGTYTGTFASGTFQIGSDVPAAKLSGAGYHFVFASVDQINNYIELGASRTGDRSCTNIISAVEASSIDTKIDDGIPTLGKVRGDIYGWPAASGGSWSTASCISGSAYVLTNTAANSCRLGFVVP